MTPIRKYNPGFLTDDELIASFCVRKSQFESIMEMLRECSGSSNPHQIVVGPRGSGKTSLLLRVVAEVRRDAELSSRFFPIVFAEESYEVATAGEFWLECLSHLAAQAPPRENDPNLHRTVEDLRTIRDDQTLADRCLGRLVDFAQREKKRLVLVVENLNMMFADMTDSHAGWTLRHTLQNEPSIILLGSATSRFAEIDHSDNALYEFFRILTLRPLDTKECTNLWEAASGRSAPPEQIRSLEILTGGSPRLLAIIARFGADLSLRELMARLLDLVDDHTEYFKGHLESLPAQERRVYLGLADLWKPATTKEIADRSRLNTSKCSAQLTRLTERGVVQVAGGSARRKQYYLTERLYNIYYLLRRNRGPDRLIEALIRFMESYYSPQELRGISANIICDAEGQDPETQPLYRTDPEQALGRPEDAVDAVGRAIDHHADASPESRWRDHLIRAKASLAGGDPSACEHDVGVLLSILPEFDSLPRKKLSELLQLSVDLGPAQMRDVILTSAAADLLLPLTTALEWELGLEPRVAREVEEVAQDVRNELRKLQEAQAGG